MKKVLCAFVVHILTIVGSVNSQFQGQFGFGFGQPQRQQYNNNPFFGGFNYQHQQQQQPNPQNSQIYYPQQNQQNRPVFPNRGDTIQYPGNRPANNNYNINYRPMQATTNQRLSERKCLEYLKSFQNSVLVGSLSLIPNIQGVNTDQCDSSQGLVIGGENAKPGEFPHMAAIGYRNIDNEISYKCGGSLISERYVLTAAHCRSADRAKPSEVRLGDLNLRLKESGLPEKNVGIEKFIAHEQYDPNDNKNDIAVIRLIHDVSFNKYIRPACLATPKILLQNRKAIATGWGLTESFTDKTSDIMQKVELNIINNNVCDQLLDDSERVLDNSQVCAGELAGGKDTCQGDSGGPLQIVSDTNKCVYLLIGITSYGSIYCGSANSPGVYARVSWYLDWIERKVWGS